MALSVDAFGIIEVAYVSVLAIVFILLAFVCQRKTWMWCGMTTMFACGVAYVAVPQHVLKFQAAKELDSTAVVMARSYGTVLLGTSTQWFLLHDTRDATVHITLLMSYVVSSSLEMMAQLFSYFISGKNKPGTDGQTSSVWSDQFLILFGLPTLCWMLGNLIHLLRSRDFNTYPQHNTRLNNHLRVDAWLLLLMAITILTFPRQIFNLTFAGAVSANEVILHLMRCKGAMLVGEAITSLQAPGFLHSRDKLALFTARIFAGVIAVALYVAGVFMFDMAVNVSYHGPLLVLLLINAVVARFTDVTTIYVVPTPSKPKQDKEKAAAAPVQSGSGEVPATKED